MSQTGVILLAAGESRRLGQPKQLLPFRGSTLLRFAAETAIAAGIGPVVVVLGAYGEECRNCLKGLALQAVYNESWAKGMGGSIAVGMMALASYPLEGVVILLCDQPALRPEIIKGLLDLRKTTGAGVVASSYGGTSGPPALFMHSYFARLRALDGETGARSLIGSGADVQLQAFPGGELDIDEPAHVARLTA